ncbi:MAG TPA: copper resistance protein B [Allosphingosinicella sp.]|jgi:copper resistance protein B
MLRFALPAGLLVLAAPAEAQQLPYDLGETPAATGESEPDSGHPPWLQYALLDRFEWGIANGQDSYAWDFSALLGGERNRLYLASSGEGVSSGRLDYAEFEALYSRYVGGDVDLNFGLRYDLLPHPHRAYAALGAQYDDDRLWVGAWTYLSNKSELSARLAGYYNLKLIGPLVLQPSWELDANAADVPALGLGRGFSYAELGLRLRYEIREAFAPYVGLSWSRDLGRTARLDRAAGEDPESKSLVMGVRSAF